MTEADLLALGFFDADRGAARNFVCLLLPVEVHVTLTAGGPPEVWVEQYHPQWESHDTVEMPGCRTADDLKTLLSFVSPEDSDE